MLAGLPPKGDVSNWISAGGTVEQFWQLVETALDWVKSEPGAEADANPARAQAADEEQRLIDELARLNQVNYDRRRTQAANELGIRRSALDYARQAKRAEIEADRGTPPLFGHWLGEPWAQPVAGAALVLAIKRRIRRPVVLP